jgi:hypothetical protein
MTKASYRREERRRTEDSGVNHHVVVSATPEKTEKLSITRVWDIKCLRKLVQYNRAI